MPIHSRAASLSFPPVHSLPRSIRRVALLFGSSMLVYGCDTPVEPEATPSQPELRFARVTNPRATFTYFDQASEQRGDGSQSGLITGDNRDAGGTSLAGSSVYDDGACGVKAQVFVGGSGDATLDPTGNRMTNCNNSVARSLTLSYGSPIVGNTAGSVTAAHFTNVREVEQLPYGGLLGNVGYRRFRLQPRGTTPCDWVRYGTTVGNEHVDFTTTINGVPVTSKPMRLEAIALNTWIASSQPNSEGKHVAVCESAIGKGVSFTAAYDIPFRIKVVMKN